MKIGYFSRMNFEDLKLTRQFLNAIEDEGFSNPTPIQIKAIPAIRSGQDIIGIAQTGTGKTAAYALPILQVLKYAQGDHPRCLVLVPTKELALQIEDRMKALAKYTDLRIVGLYGGVGPNEQIARIKEGVDIIVSTPGRFLEIYHKGALHPRKIKHFILDEADRMMDMGFMPQIRNIQELIPQKRQNLLFSATYPPKVENLGEEFLLFPTRIEITPQSTAVETVEQSRYHAPNFKTKLNLLHYFLENEEEFRKVIVFVKMKDYAESIGKDLEQTINGGVRVIHSNKGQNSRINALNDFKNSDVRVLVSTDVSARGIDIPKVSHVINFSVPMFYDDYVHRIGRTGRAFQAGVAITFCDPTEIYHIKKIEEIIRQEIPMNPLPESIELTPTEGREKQLQLRAIDFQKKKEDPTFQGAFHDKKKNKKSTNRKKRSNK